MQTIPIIILAIYTFLTIIAANVILRKKLGSEHFLVAGRELPLMLVVAVVLGDWVGGNATIGVSQRGYTTGISGAWYTISLGISMLVFAVTLAGRFRRFKAVTIPEIIGRFFDPKTRLISAIVIGIAYFIAGITQIIAGGALLAPLLGMEKWAADLVSAIIFIAVITAGGLKSIAIVNILQVLVIFGDMLLSMFFSVDLIGGSFIDGISRLRTELPSSFWNLYSGETSVLSGEILATILTVFAGQAAITGIFAAKDVKTAIKGSWVAGLLLIPVGFIFAIIGMCARVYFGDSLPFGLSAASAMMLATSPFIAGICLCGLFGAIVSTGPLCFLAPTQVFIRDIYSVYINPGASDKRKLIISRLSAVFLLILGWIISVTLTEVLKITYWGFAFRIGIAVILLSVVYIGYKRISGDGAFWGLIIGAIVFGLWNWAGTPMGIHVAIPTFVSVLISTLLISFFKKRSTEPDDETKEILMNK